MLKRNVAARMLFVLSLLAASNAQAQEQQAQSAQDEITQLQAQVDALRAQVTTANLLAAVQHLNAAGFHAMDEALHAGELNPRYLNTVRNTIKTANAVVWPEGLKDQAAGFVEAAERLETALADEDVDAAAQAASEAHDAHHVLTHAIFAYLAGEESAHGGHAESTDTTSAQIPEDALRFDLQLNERGGVAGRPATFRVNRGDTVAFSIQSATAGSLHLHGYRVEAELQAGEETVVSFTADATGRFPMEVHPEGQEQGVVVGYLEVHP